MWDVTRDGGRNCNICNAAGHVTRHAKCCLFCIFFASFKGPGIYVVQGEQCEAVKNIAAAQEAM